MGKAPYFKNRKDYNGGPTFSTSKSYTMCIYNIIELVDSISRDGPDMYIYILHYRTPNISEQVNLEDF